MLLIYNILLVLCSPFVALYYGMKMVFTGKYRKGFGQRFGVIPSKIIAGMKGNSASGSDSSIAISG